MLMGEFHHTLDEKNRLIIPAKFREELGSEYIITRGLDNCLFIYSRNEWEKIVSTISALPFTKKDVRNFSRFFLSGATNGHFDKQGRIILTSLLIDYANLTKECVIIGVNDRIEIWDENSFETFMENGLSEFSLIAEDLFKGEYNA